MKVSELKAKLLSEGCNQNNFAILSRSHDAICLDKKENKWVVFYNERGTDSEPIFKSTSENKACKFFFNYVKKQRHLHMVGFFKKEKKAEKLESKLNAIGIKPIRNDIPAYKNENDQRYRVFVEGKDIFKVKDQLCLISIHFA